MNEYTGSQEIGLLLWSSSEQGYNWPGCTCIVCFDWRTGLCWELLAWDEEEFNSRWGQWEKSHGIRPETSVCVWVCGLLRGHLSCVTVVPLMPHGWHPDRNALEQMHSNTLQRMTPFSELFIFHLFSALTFMGDSHETLSCLYIYKEEVYYIAQRKVLGFYFMTLFSGQPPTP